MACSVREIADWIGARLFGDGSIELRGISSIAEAAPGDLVFVEDERHLERALGSRAAAVIAGEFFQVGDLKPVLVCDQPRLAFARAAQRLGTKRARKAAIHPSASVDPSAECGAGVSIDERVVIREGVQIGERTWIGAGSVIGAQAILGKDCELYPRVTVYPGVRMGNRVIAHSGAVLGSDGFGYVRDRVSGRHEKFPQVGRLEIGDDVEIGANSTVDRGALEVTRIGRGTKIDNLVHVGHNVEIGEDVVIAAQTGVSGSVEIGDDVVIGGQVGIGDHVRIEAGAVLGAQSGIPTKKVIRGRGVVFWGTPARPIQEYLRELAVLARMAKRR